MPKTSTNGHQTISDKKRFRLGIYFLCVVFSSFLWLLIKMSQDYTIGLTLPIRITDIPTEKVIGGQAEKDINISCTSNGFNLFRIKYLQKSKQINVSLDEIPFRQINQVDYYISMGNLKGLLSEKLGLNESGISITDDQLQFRLENLASKEVVVQADATLSFRQQFGLYGTIVINPPKVTLFGPQEVLDTIDTVRTATVVLNDLYKNTNITTTIDPGTARLKAQTNKITLSIPVEQFTETSLLVDITVPRIDQHLKTFPDKAEVFFLVPMKDFMKIQPDSFVLSLDTTGLARRSPLLRVQLLKFPELLKIIRLQPSEVEYLLVN
ncbi:MAG: YbbR-like domain-containing protein [Bacteroidetes bacterium]|nr:YbbR-like domain-containing protein [Bacteroidota bacterium]